LRGLKQHGTNKKGGWWMAGWVKLHRKLLNSSVFQNPNILKFWVWCLLKATHTEYETRIGIQKVTLLKGQFPFGRDTAAVELNMKPTTVYKYLNQLKKENLIEVNSNNKFSVVTIVNWELYQEEEGEPCQLRDNNVTTKEQQRDTNKNVKNDKNVKKNIYSDLPPELETPLKEFLEHRKKIKKPMSDHAVELMIKKLVDLSGGDIKTSIQILEQSILNGWAGVFPLKQIQKGQKEDPFDNFLKEAIADEQGRSRENYEDSQRELPKLL
jgi:hypothetical protein